MLTNGRKWGQEKITGLWIKEPLNTHPGFTALVSEWELPTEAFKLLFWARTAWAGQALAAYTVASFLTLNLLVRSGLGLAHQFRLLRVTCLIVLDRRSFSFGDQGYVTFGGRGRAFASPNRLGPACFYLVLFLKDKMSEQAWFDSARQRISPERRVEKKNPKHPKGACHVHKHLAAGRDSCSVAGSAFISTQPSLAPSLEWEGAGNVSKATIKTFKKTLRG